MGRAKVGERPTIAVVTSTFPPSVGGSEQYHLFTARALAETARVVVLTSDLMLAGGGSPAASQGVEVRYLPSIRLLGEAWMLPGALWQELRKLRPDFIWLNCPSLGADTGGIYAQLAGTPWAATYHADLSQEAFYRRLYTRLESVLLRRANLLYVTSEPYRAIELARGIRPERVRVVPTGPYVGDGGRLKPAGAGVSEEDRAGPEHRFLFVGGLDRHHAYKRLDLLLTALKGSHAENEAPMLWIVGDGDRRPSFEATVASLGLAQRVTFLGRIDDLALVERYHSAWALVLPSNTLGEGFGTVAVEAAAYGCPVIAPASVPSAAMLATFGGAVLYDAGDPDGLPRALRSVWGSSQLRRQLAEGARKAAEELRWEQLLPRFTAPVLEEIRRHGAPREGASA
jgi:glycosyltransferase involved in cell wall biosynthesis